jgi:hypothetical protein
MFTLDPADVRGRLRSPTARQAIRGPDDVRLIVADEIVRIEAMGRRFHRAQPARRATR